MGVSGAIFRYGAIIGLAAAGIVYGAAAPAQETQPPAEPEESPSDLASALVGAWEFSNADHDKVCHFNLRADPAPGGYKLDIDKNCATVFPNTKEIVGWSIDKFGALGLLDASGNTVIELTEAETGIYDGFEPGQGRYILQSAASATVRSATDMVGDWAITRGTGRPICLLTLANNAAGTDTLTLTIKPGCDPLVTRFNPTSWRMDQGDLVLISAHGQFWRFEENDANSWQRVPESPDPVLLVRQ
jgi:Protease inhibitor Inh